MTALKDYTSSELSSPVTYRSASGKFESTMEAAAAQFNAGLQNALSAINVIKLANLVTDSAGELVLDSGNPQFTPINLAIGAEDPLLFEKYRNEMGVAVAGVLAQLSAEATQLTTIFPASE